MDGSFKNPKISLEYESKILQDNKKNNMVIALDNSHIIVIRAQYDVRIRMYRKYFTFY